MKCVLLVLLLAFIYLESASAGLQKYAVKGKLLCGTQAARGVDVKLVDEDDGPNPDDEMDASTTDANGEFLLQGKSSEITNIDARLKIYHDCNDGTPCQRKWKLILPDKYISKGVMDVGTLNLEMGWPEESKDCIH